MALTKQNIPVPFGQGVNTKTDPKQLPPGPLTNLQNGIFNEQGAINKRYGLDLLERAVNTTDELILRGEALSTYQNQLLLFTGAKAFSRLGFNEKWADKGNVSSVINNTFQVIRNDYEQSNPDVAKVNNLECYVWEDSRGGVRYSVVDSATGNFIVNDNLISLEGSKPKVQSLLEDGDTAAQFVVFFTTGTTLKYTRLYTNALHTSPIVFTLTSDIHEDLVYDCCTSIGSVDGEESSAIFLTYAARFNSTYVYTYPRTYKIEAIGASLWSYDFTLNTSTVATHIAVAPMADASFSLSALAGVTAMIMWDDGYDLKLGKIPYYIGPLTSIDITVPIDFHISELEKAALCWNGEVFTDQADLDVFFQFTRDGYTWVKAGTLQAFMHGEIYAVGALTGLSMRKEVALYSKPFNYNENSYIVLSYESDLQPTYFLANVDLEVVSKANQNLGGGHRTEQLSEVIMDSYTISEFLSADGYDIGVPLCDGVFKVPTLKKGKLQSESGNIFSRLGVTSTSMDFASTNHFLSTNLNDNMYVVGGVLQSYDGNIFTENGFHIYPEDLLTAITVMGIAVVTTGTGVAAEVTDIVCVSASRIQPGDYWTLNSGLDVREYYVWYRVDGVGTDPDITNKIGIQVNISSYYSSTQVATATKNSINLFYDDFSATSTGPTVTVTNTIPGATTNATTGIMCVGEVGAGTYLYTACWKWVDNQGRIHRSAPAIAETVITIAGNRTVTISVPILSLTNKPNVVLEVYRTESLGGVFYQVTSLSNPTFNIVNNDGYYQYVHFIDTTSDAGLISNELLYTTGDVLENNSPPPCSIITTYKNRVFIAGLDNKNVLQYSKILPPENKNFAAGFSDLLTIELDQSGGDVVALAPLDDKLIIFKEKQIYYINGDGPNNTGAGSTFTEPQLITTDVGCLNANSIVTMPNGLMFQSNKGIYLLSRGLQVEYKGAPVETFNSLTISSAILINDINQVRFVTEDGVALVYDYYFDQWSTFTNYLAVDCDLFQNNFVLLRTGGEVMQENTDSYADGYDGGTQHIPLVIETANFSFAGLNGFQRVYRATLLGEYKGSHNTVVSFAYDYSPVYVDSATFDGYSVIGQYAYGSTGPYGETNGDIYGGDYVPYQFRIHLKQQKCTALRVKIEDTQSAPFNEGFNLSGITLQVGIKPSTYKLPENKSLGSD
jgi:hypothetical protein